MRYRPRPVEHNGKFIALFSLKAQFRDGRIVRDPNVPGEVPDGSTIKQRTLGTPRHPAYPSGHSTYSKAASDVLARFFPDLADDFARLAENIGHARFFGGVHWLSDHTFGQEIGAAVARCVIRQLDASQISGIPNPRVDAPDPSRPYEGVGAATTQTEVPVPNFGDPDQDPLIVSARLAAEGQIDLPPWGEKIDLVPDKGEGVEQFRSRARSLQATPQV